MNPDKLSIIVPCFNCAQTLATAITSVYTQNLTIPFEIVLIDDGSTDQTKQEMARLAKIYPEIICQFHPQNLGGGAARNTGIRQASGNLIICLDSDDLLPPSTLPKLIARLKQKQCAGVIFSGYYPFQTQVDYQHKIDFELKSDQPVTLANLFSGQAWTGQNFLFTKAGYELAGGYPIDHPFDTQGFGFRFLANNLRVFPCPQAYLCQRQFAAEQESYFERAYKTGLFSVGHYLIFREYLEIFSSAIQQTILNFPIFTANTLDHNILLTLQQAYQNQADRFWSEPLKQTGPNPEKAYQQGQFAQAEQEFSNSNHSYLNAEFDHLRYQYGVTHHRPLTLTEYQTWPATKIKPHGCNEFRLSIWQRLRRKLRKLRQS